MDSALDVTTPALDAPEDEQTGKLTGSTRRTFIRDLAIAGTSTSAALYGLDAAGVADLVADAKAADVSAPLSEFTAIAPSSADAFETPPGIAWSVVIAYNDTFANTDGTVYRFGYNNDYTAFFPLKATEEGLLFVNHEYPDPFFQHGFKAQKSGPTPRANGRTTKSIADVELEKEVTGNSIVHLRRRADGAWAVVSPSPYNRRIFGGKVQGMPDTSLSYTGPLAQAGAPGSSAPDLKVHGAQNRADGSMANCSGGTTPWGTALSCEENYDGYGITFRNSTQDFTYGWDSVDPARPRTEQQDGSYVPAAPAEYFPRTGAAFESRKYGWVCEHDPYDAASKGSKHTALGRFRHENTAFRVVRGRKFVLYMGDDQSNQAIYKFVSSRAFDPAGSRADHLKILTEGTLYVARFAPEGRRRYASTPTPGAATPDPVTATAGTGTWVPVATSDLFDTRLRLAGVATDSSPSRRPRQQTSLGNDDPSNEGTFAGRYNRLISKTLPASDPNYVYKGDPAPSSDYVNEWDTHFATNRPEDVEVARDGSVLVALTNNTTAGVNDPYGAVRRLREKGNDPEATSFTWEEFAAGGPRPGGASGEQGFASPDNLVFDSQDNIWIVTDISSSSLKGSVDPRPIYDFHANNAIFMLPRGGEQGGVAYRFANMPIQSEGTGPYFTPDESTLFVTVQHPGEETKNLEASILGQPTTYTSYWPGGNKTTGANPSEPKPSVVAIYRTRSGDGQQPTPPKAPVGPGVPQPPAPSADTTPPVVRISPLKRTSLRSLRSTGVEVTVDVNEAARLEVTLTGRVRSRTGRRTRTTASSHIGTAKRNVSRAGKYTVRVKPSVIARLLLTRSGADLRAERIVVEATDRSGNTRRVSRPAVVTKK